MVNKFASDTEITLTNFLNLIGKSDSGKEETVLNVDVDYDTLWKFVNTEEKQLLKAEIISIEEKRVNSKKKIINIEAFIKCLTEYLNKQKHLSITKFLKKTGLPLSYTTLYRLIEDKEKELKKHSIVEVIRNENKKNIKIISPEKMESFLKDNRIGGIK